MFPWLYWSPTYHFPLSGAVHQDIETDWFAEEIEPESGNADIERQVFHEVGSYGTQIGLLNQAILALAKELNCHSIEQIPALKKIEAIQEQVAEIKAQNKTKTRKKAQEIFEELARTDAEFLEELLERYSKIRR